MALTLASILTTRRLASPAIIIPSSAPNSPEIVLDYLDLASQIFLFQHRLLTLTDIQPQQAVTIILPNSLEFTIAFLGSAISQLVVAPLNPNYTEEEFKFYLEDSASKVVIVPKGWVNDSKPAVKATKRLNDVILLEIWWDDLEKDVKLQVKSGKRNLKQRMFWNRGLSKRDVALLLHTSGTTGRPKGVPLTHKNLVTTMKNIVNTYKLVPDDRTLLVMPLFHVHGLMCGLLAPLLAGGTVVIPPRFSATTFWKDFLDHGCTWYTAVPTIHQILLRHPPPPGGAPKLRFIRSCSSPLAPVTLRQLEETFKAPVLEAYAMTEAAHQMTSNPLPPAPHKPGSVGLGQGVQIAILDERGNPTEEGEVCIRGDNVTHGYLNNPSANESSFTKDSWFRTGDQGKFDKDGYLFLTGRIKELINRGGEKISPSEIDGILLQHPAIAEAVSFAVPDEMYGQEVQAAVVLKQGKKVTEKELQEFSGTKMAKFKVPKRIYFTDLMPKTATGKIQRRNVSATFFKDNVKAKL